MVILNIFTISKYMVYYFLRPHNLIDTRRIKQDGSSARILSTDPDPGRLGTIRHRMRMIKSVLSPEVKRPLA